MWDQRALNGEEPLGVSSSNQGLRSRINPLLRDLRAKAAGQVGGPGAPGDLTPHRGWPTGQGRKSFWRTTRSSLWEGMERGCERETDNEESAEDTGYHI